MLRTVSWGVNTKMRRRKPSAAAWVALPMGVVTFGGMYGYNCGQ